MNTTLTIERLYDMRLGAMAEALSTELERSGDPALSFAERFGLVVEHQWAVREEGRLARRLKNAALKVDASIEEIDFTSARGLDRSVIADLAELSFLRSAGNIIITGATGLGKTYLACAIADRACRRGHTALYKRVGRLIFELAIARADGSYLKAIDRLAKVDLLILDDWGLASIEAQPAADLMDVIDDRVGRSSTIIGSQLPVSEWHHLIADPSVADALLDRLVHRSVRIELKGGSMRKQTPKRPRKLT
jgi:DNA replication protein DnaC